MSCARTGASRSMVAVDWGTTSCRFVLLDADGAALARRSGPGIIPLNASVAAGWTDRAETFARALQEQIGDWLQENPGIPLVMSGMVGADRGWRDAGYRQAPVGLLPGRDELVPVAVPGHPAYLVPGVKQHGRAPDVMRGEETQVLGALLEADGEARGGTDDSVHGTVGAGEALVIAPGTHSKWVQVADGAIRYFRTYMTGDLFAALRGHTILAADRATASGATSDRSAADRATTDGSGGEGCTEAFVRGLDLALGGERASLSRHLFRARSGMVLGDLAAEDVHEFLSGLVIGDEVADARALLAPAPGTPVLLIAADELGARYRCALDRAGLPARLVGGDPATRGLHAIARQLTGPATHDPADPTAHPIQERVRP